MIKGSQKCAKILANLDPARFQVIGGFFGSNWDLMKGNLDCCEAIKWAVIYLKSVLPELQVCLFLAFLKKKTV